MSIRPRSPTTRHLLCLSLALAGCTAPGPDAAPVATRADEVRTDPPPGDPEPTPEPAPPPQVVVSRQGPNAISVRYQCAGWVERHAPGGAVTVIPTPCSFTDQIRGFAVRADSPLQPGTQYCYVAFNVDGMSSPTACVTTPWAPYVFAGPGISQAESDQMVAAFDWRHTEPLAATVTTASGEQPAAYSMNILVNTEEDFVALRGLGIHTQDAPLFEQERQAWDGHVVMARVQGTPVGGWITAIVPGAVYNELRSKAITGLATGHPIGVRAVVFHRNTVAEASLTPLAPDLAPLDLVYLTRQGLEFNGYSVENCDEGPPRTCTVQQGVWFLWAGRKLINLGIDVVQAAYHGVRQLIGGVEKLVRDSHPVTIHIRVNNTDEAFGPAQEMTSGWAGVPLKLRHVTVRVRQGHVSEFTGTTDDNGDVTLTLLSGLAVHVYVALDDGHAVLVDNFMTRQERLGDYPALGSQSSLFVTTDNQYVNTLLALADAHDYVQTVLGHDVAKISVLTGWQSSVFTLQDRSFTPCLGRFPNVVTDIPGGLSIPNAILSTLSDIAAFTLGTDIVLSESDTRSRGVGVHEYGHAVMCDMMRSLDISGANEAWLQLMSARVAHNDDPHDPAGVLGEAFADFLALQIVGGTNYGKGVGSIASRNMSYCDGASANANACFEPNTVRCEGAGCTLEHNIEWATSVLQDAFDDVAPDPANPPIDLPNDGSHWRDVNGTLVHHRAAAQVSTADADTIHLTGSALRAMLGRWLGAGGGWTYDAFFGRGLAGALARDGFHQAEGCAMYAAHEPGGTCPSYFRDVLTP